MQRLERSVKLYEKLTGLVIQSVNPSAAVDGREGAGDVEGETTDYACYYKGRDRCK